MNCYLRYGVDSFCPEYFHLTLFTKGDIRDYTEKTRQKVENLERASIEECMSLNLFILVYIYPKLKIPKLEEQSKLLTYTMI